MTDTGLTVDILDAEGRTRCTNCLLRIGRYVSNDNIAIEAVCTDRSVTSSGEHLCRDEPWAVLTVNTDVKLPDDMAAIKDYSEGEGNLRTLVAAGIVMEPPLRLIPSGFVQIPVCRLTRKGSDLVAKIHAPGCAKGKEGGGDVAAEPEA